MSWSVPETQGKGVDPNADPADKAGSVQVFPTGHKAGGTQNQ